MKRILSMLALTAACTALLATQAAALSYSVDAPADGPPAICPKAASP